ncbi:MAG: HAD family hydrolase [Acidobacteriota bacterium]
MPIYLHGRELDALLFDFDGTLVDASAAIVRSFQAAFRRRGLAVPDEAAVRRLIGYPLRDAFAHLAPEGEVESLVEVYRAEFWQRSRDGARLLPGARELLKAAAPVAFVGVVSSRSHRGVLDLLDYFRLRETVHVIVAADDVSEPKPSPAPLLAALDRLGVAPVRAAMIGDTPLDTAAGATAGVLSVGVTTGSYSAAELAEAGADLVVTDLRELHAYCILSAEQGGR